MKLFLNEIIFRTLRSSLVEYIRKHAVRLLRLREQHTPPRSIIIIIVSWQLMHFLIHTSQWKVNHYLSLSLLFYWAQKLRNIQFRLS